MFLAIGFAETNASISKVFAAIAIITFVLFIISVFSDWNSSSYSPEDAIIQLNNISLSRYKSSLYNDELEPKYKRLPDDIVNKYYKAYVFLEKNNIDMTYSNEELDAEVDKISEYNEELNSKYIKDKEVENKEINDFINESLNDDNKTKTENYVDYADRIIQCIH